MGRDINVILALAASAAVLAAPAAPHVWAPYTATAYTADCEGCTGITKTGVDVRQTIYHEDKRVIAVDPRHIPLGSTVDIRLADGTHFTATAQDIGGAIKGERIDILFETTEEALEFGRQSVDLKIRKGTVE